MRDEKVISIRPNLNLPKNSFNPIEGFQNHTLRPILKFQNPLTKQLLDNSKHFQKRLDKVGTANVETYQSLLNNYLSSDLVFKNRLIGCIVGLMHKDELEFYLAHASEINKRIMQMQVQRYVSQYE